MGRWVVDALKAWKGWFYRLSQDYQDNSVGEGEKALPGHLF